MLLTDEELQWVLKFNDGQVNYIHIDFRLSLDMVDASGKASLTIETPCRLNSAGEEASLVPSKPLSLAPILPLFNAQVIGITIRKTGQLKVEFANGQTLEVNPDGLYEAWQLGCTSINSLFVCSPGGKVAFFQRLAKGT